MEITIIILVIFLQEAVRHHEGKVSSTEPYIFQTEITGRDKDHVSNTSLMIGPYLMY